MPSVQRNIQCVNAHNQPAPHRSGLNARRIFCAVPPLPFRPSLSAPPFVRPAERLHAGHHHARLSPETPPRHSVHGPICAGVGAEVRNWACAVPPEPVCLTPSRCACVFDHNQLHGFTTATECASLYCRRYFVLTGTVLRYYRSERDVAYAPRGVVDIQVRDASAAVDCICAQQWAAVPAIAHAASPLLDCRF